MYGENGRAENCVHGRMGYAPVFRIVTLSEQAAPIKIDRAPAKLTNTLNVTEAGTFIP